MICYASNTGTRRNLAIEAGADSTDGSSASRFAVSLPLLDCAAKQGSLLAP